MKRPVPRTRRSRTMLEAPYKANEVDESPVTRKSKRRNSMSVFSNLAITGKNAWPNLVVDNAMMNGSGKRKSSRRIEESDTEEIECPAPDTQEIDEGVQETINLANSTDVQVYVDDVVAIDLSPRKRAIAVEIPAKPPSRANSKPLKEIVVENIPTPYPCPRKSSTEQQESPERTETREGLKNAQLANAPSTLNQETPRNVVEMSPPRQLNVASILAKSPNRPAYRVGLSKRVNVEPLHGYLKRKAL